MQKQEATRPTWKGIAVSILTAAIFVLACNIAAYKYVQVQAISTESQVTMMEAWLGLQKLNGPVDTLLLGDSACRVNLAPGAFADRLGGNAINLGSTAQTSFLTDAWMLSDYVSRFGAPRTVVVTRTSVAYAITHNVEFLANAPLPWAYWDKYGLVPAWQKGEVRQTFLTKYWVLNSDADVLRQRLLRPWDLFTYSVQARVPAMDYTSGGQQAKVPMDIASRTPAFYFDKFYYSADTTNAIKQMTALAKKHHFQLYFTLQAEWDQAVNAGLRAAHLAAEKEYLARFTDETYVHVVEQLPGTLFTTEQMQSPNHLWRGFEKVYTEEIINGITASRNDLTAALAVPLELTAVSLDKVTYGAGDKPVITLSVGAGRGLPASQVTGSVSCLVKPSGGIDGAWVIRAPAVDFTVKDSDKTEITLRLTAGQLGKAGTYDLVIFLRQDVQDLSHETRIDMPKAIVVK